MGKISDALEKVMEEKERRKQPDFTQASPAPENKREISPGQSIDGKKREARRRKIIPEEKPNRKERIYIARAADGSGIDPRIVTYFDYSSPLSEQYRLLRTNIKSCLLMKTTFNKLTLAKSIGSPRIFAITSSAQGEGKTVTAVNLAVSLAHDLENKVLLVDCDLRGGSVDKMLNINCEPGLSEILNQEVNFNTVIHSTKVNNLFVIPCGKSAANPTELLGSKRMKMAIERFKAESFNYIILDTPPLLPFTDAGILGARTDGAIFVVQAQKTQSQAVKRAKELLEQAQSRFLGFILTHVDSYAFDSYGYNYHYYYKNNQ